VSLSHHGAKLSLIYQSILKCQIEYRSAHSLLLLKMKQFTKLALVLGHILAVLTHPTPGPDSEGKYTISSAGIKAQVVQSMPAFAR
jgi:hypothetical protein